MKTTPSILIVTLCVCGFAASANAALTLVPSDLREAVLVSDAGNPDLTCYLAISSDVLYEIIPTAPIAVTAPVQANGFDWIFVYNTDLLENPVNPLVTITLLGIEVFGMDTTYQLSVWDETGTEQLSLIGITVPEPGTVALLGLGAIGVWRKRK